MFYSRSITI